MEKKRESKFDYERAFEDEDKPFFIQMYNVVFLANKETAFIHAITAAGVMHTLTRNCSLGHFNNCGCDESKLTNSGQWLVIIVQSTC